MLFASSASNDCECTNTLAHKTSQERAKTARFSHARPDLHVITGVIASGAAARPAEPRLSLLPFIGPSSLGGQRHLRFFLLSLYGPVLPRCPKTAMRA